MGYRELYNIKVKVSGKDIGSNDFKNYLEFKYKESKVMINKYIKDITKKYDKYRGVSIYEKKSYYKEINNYL